MAELPGPGLTGEAGEAGEDRRPGWMVRKMIAVEQKLSQSQGSSSSQEVSSSSQQFSCSQEVLAFSQQFSNSQEVPSSSQQFSSSQDSQQFAGETQTERAKTGAGWLVSLTEETFRKQSAGGNPQDVNTKSKTVVFSKTSPEVPPAETFPFPPLQTEEDSAQSVDSDLTFSLQSCPGPSPAFKAPSKTKAGKTSLADGFKAPKAKGSRKKKEKDPNAPKRCKSSYLYFCEEVRAGLKQERPELSLTELSRELGRRWQQVADRSKYEARAQEDRARYAGEKEEYEKSSPQPPKKAKSSFIFFCNELRPEVAQENPRMSVTDIGKELGKRWNATEEAGRAKYQAMAVEDRKRFDQERENFDKSNKTGSAPAAKGKNELQLNKKNISKPKQKKITETPKKSKAKKSGVFSKDEETESSNRNTEGNVELDSSVLVEDLLDQVLSNILKQAVNPSAVKKRRVLPAPAKKAVREGPKSVNTNT